MSYYVVSFSGGKDSTAMLLRLLELGQQIDEVIFCDTYKEFPQMYQHIERVKQVVESHNIPFTTLKNEYSFDYWMFEHEPKRRKPEEFKEKYGDAKGYSWADSRSRWCTTILKTQIIDKYIKSLGDVIQYVGIAADETERLERQITQQGKKLYPLVEWGWSEADCLAYCYSLGYDWGGLYQIFDRVSCWCCPLKGLDELRKLRKHFPELWDELRQMDANTWRQFRKDYSVEDLEKRFTFEEERLAAGKSIRNREFYQELKKIQDKS